MALDASEKKRIEQYEGNTGSPPQTQLASMVTPEGLIR